MMMMMILLSFILIYLFMDLFFITIIIIIMIIQIHKLEWNRGHRHKPFVGKAQGTNLRGQRLCPRGFVPMLTKVVGYAYESLCLKSVPGRSFRHKLLWT